MTTTTDGTSVDTLASAADCCSAGNETSDLVLQMACCEEDNTVIQWDENAASFVRIENTCLDGVTISTATVMTSEDLC